MHMVLLGEGMGTVWCTLEGRALTWWNGNVQTLGLANANQIHWSNVKAMMTTEYCPTTEIQKMEQELWTLTLKEDDIKAYSNRFHKLVLMCPELVPTEKKKIKKYIRGFPERIKGNITSSKPATLDDAINMARELVEQSVQGRAARIGESNKRKWEDHQRNANNNNLNNHNNNRNRNNNHHQQQNRRQETAKAYVAAPAEGRGYAGNLPRFNRCNSHHNGQCPLKCRKCQRTGYQEKDCRVRLPGAGNEGARGRAYVVVENPQQNPNVIAGTFLLNDHYACILFDFRVLHLGRALTWWNGNVQTLGLANANQIPWSNLKAMMTNEYYPATKIQKMEQELWTLTLKGDDIEAYNNRFHELALMCPELVPIERKKSEKYVRVFPERIKGNITSSKPTTLHDAINMARELVEQAIQGRATRIGESNKRKWEDHQRNTSNNNPNNNNNRNRNNNHHQQQNRRQETARAYAATPAEGRGSAGNLPRCNRCNSHHNGQCPPKC
nr:hypothetical protein [Tanacetum cinerariifolium]